MALLLAAAGAMVAPSQAQRYAHPQRYRMNVQGPQARRPMTPPQTTQHPQPQEAAHTTQSAARPQPQQGQTPANYAQAGQQNHPAPIERQAPAAPVERKEGPPPNAVVRSNPNPSNPRAATQFKGDHIAEWMVKHKNLTPEQQQQELGRDPGFRAMPPVVQQHLRDRLAQLNALPAKQRDQTIDRIETLQSMSPNQRQQFRDAMSQWSSLPPDQKRAVKRSFLQIRQLPPDQRNAAIASGRFTAGFNDAQRTSLNNLVRVEPWMPADVGGGR